MPDSFCRDVRFMFELTFRAWLYELGEWLIKVSDLTPPELADNPKPDIDHLMYGYLKRVDPDSTAHATGCGN